MIVEAQPSHSRHRLRTSGSRLAERWQPSDNPENKNLQQVYHPGMRVMHPTWGEGLVLNSRLQDNDEIVDVFFEEMGLKRVVASLAGLEIKT